MSDDEEYDYGSDDSVQYSTTERMTEASRMTRRSK